MQDEFYVPKVDPRPADQRELDAVGTKRDRSERWILAVLLAEPHRWHGLVDRVHVTDFTDPARRKLADLYWQQQQDEGERVFNEFLDVLRASASSGQSPEVASLAVELLAELEDPTTAPDAAPKPGVLLAEAVRLLDEVRAGGERDKLVADLRRNSAGADGAAVLRELAERAGRPDMRRIGS